MQLTGAGAGEGCPQQLVALGSHALLPGHQPSMGTGHWIGIGGTAFLLTWNDKDHSPML